MAMFKEIDSERKSDYWIHNWHVIQPRKERQSSETSASSAHCLFDVLGIEPASTFLGQHGACKEIQSANLEFSGVNVVATVYILLLEESPFM
jgi:hypothetical protein